MKKNIGKKVYELVKVGNWSYVINKEKTYTIVGFKDYDEVDDHNPHYIIKDDEGNEKELLDYEVVFCPNDEYNGDEQIYHYLRYPHIITVHCCRKIAVNMSCKDKSLILSPLGYRIDDIAQHRRSIVSYRYYLHLAFFDL